ncbi:HD domain-containing protein [Aggregatibacter actinomycetemcomitans]|uniref:HD domain-containing protein n=1 Tax=Aggregatibacter actinomycetemcomitans TaxID=714 RepID=UPI00197B6703|nr:HD domain-containing protein [Aggregatibacter actinomycetemcomitans]MBN6067318.1 HD domain-containing protein [Aggregatibacter actinomycetemcomitans]MBN6084862.1 HD domain-containing protein [Aggregatibacter actinomycetemcomitans]
MTLSTRAELFAKSIHHNQMDKAGKPYIQHLQAVVDNLVDPSDEMVAVAWLHDSVEDTEITLNDLSRYFGDTVSDAVSAITKVKGESYDKYLSRVRANPIARLVKIADLTHNMDLSRLPVVTEKDLVRQEKYVKAKAFLEN